MKHYYGNINSLCCEQVWLVLLPVFIVAVYVVECVVSEGFYHPDEHFQIVEFAQWKLGNSTSASVAWELPSHIRPTLQPCLCICVLRLCRLCGIESPFVQDFTLRLIAMCVSLAAMTAFYKANIKFVDAKCRSDYLFVSFLLWFLPAVNVRFSSETMSGAFLLMCLSMVVRLDEKPSRSDVVVGILAGLSFAFRYQVAFGLAGILAWALAVKRYSWRKYALFALGFLAVTAVCTLMDSWFYGEWLFVPYRYFKVNILDGVASSFGETPWYGYLVMILCRPTLVIGVVVMWSICLAVFCHGKHPAVWCIVAFIVGHSFVAHKELRFLFPIVSIVPLLLVWFIEKMMTYKIASRCLCVVFIVVNLGGLLMLASKPAAYGKARMMRMAAAAWQSGKTVYVSQDGNPFVVAGFLEPSFYKNDAMCLRDFKNDIEQCSPGERQERLKSGVVVLAERETAEREWLMTQGVELLARSVPSWVERMNSFYGVYDPQWTLLMYGK